MTLDSSSLLRRLQDLQPQIADARQLGESALQQVCPRMFVASTIEIEVDPDLPPLILARPLDERAAERVL